MPETAEGLTFAQSIQRAIADEMRSDSSTILFGLGVTDPGRVFGTTEGLVEEFGAERVFETPTSENAMTGVAVGAALGGLRPIVTHQRADFFYLALDQLVNSAAKWRFMFGAQFAVPLVVRLIVGRGWGQGPTHSQNMVHWLSQLPGIETYYPSSASNAYSLMRAAIRSDNPSVFFEDRWLHGTRDLIEEGKTKKTGTDKSELTLVSYGFGARVVAIASEILRKNGVATDVVALKRLDSNYVQALVDSISRSKRILLLDQGSPGGTMMDEVLGKVMQRVGNKFLFTARKLAIPRRLQPTSYGAMSDFYPDVAKVLSLAGEMTETDVNTAGLRNRDGKHDVPDDQYLGPF